MPTAAIPVLKAALALQTNETIPLATPHAGPIVTSSKLRKQDGIQVLAETGKPFTRIVEDRHANNKLEARRSLVDGRVQGVWLEWYDSGSSAITASSAAAWATAPGFISTRTAKSWSVRRSWRIDGTA